MDAKNKTITMSLEEYEEIKKKLEEFEAGKIMVWFITSEWQGYTRQRIQYQGKDEIIQQLTKINAEHVAKIELLLEDCKKLDEKHRIKKDLASRIKFLFTGEVPYEE